MKSDCEFKQGLGMKTMVCVHMFSLNPVDQWFLVHANHQSELTESHSRLIELAYLRMITRTLFLTSLCHICFLISL